MARARNIKPSFFTNDELAEQNCPLGRLFFAGLWCQADYKGDLEWRPSRLKVQLLPYDDCDIKKIAINLDKSGFVTFYSDGEKIYLRINNFEKHQNPHPNERKKGSEIPEYTEKLRQLVDLQTLTINHDKSRQVSDDSISDHADSPILIPDPLIPDSLNPPAGIPTRDQLLADFETLWSMFGDYGEKGSKKKALDQFQKLKPDKDLFQAMITGLQNLTADKAAKAAAGQFYENFPHVERWIRDKRWTDEVSKPSPGRPIGHQRPDPADEALFAKYPHLRPQ